MRDKILALFANVSADRAVEHRGNSIWLKCPAHGGGSERTQSLKVSLDGPFSGSHFCFGCRISGGWSKTVKLLGFPSSARFSVGEVVSDPFSDDEVATMVGTKGVAKDEDFREKWPIDQKWRGVPGDIISAVGGSLVFSRQEPVLRLPAMVRGVERGFIDCVILPNKGEKRKYLNSSNEKGWSRDVLFPYDYVRSLDSKVVALVEGPRDALVSIRNGLPALATLGASSWSDKCAQLVLALAPSTLLLMFDPDDAGEGLRKTVYASLCDQLNVINIRLPNKMVEGKRKKICDPADLNKHTLAKVLEAAHVAI